MMSEKKRQNIVVPFLSKEPEIGRWLWAMADARSRTMEELERLSPLVLDWQPPNDESTISTILYHLAAIEADWLYTEVLERPYPSEFGVLFPYDVREKDGRLTQVRNETLDTHLGRLERVRTLLLSAYEQMTLDDFRRPRSFEHYDVTPEWVLHHLMQHEAEHRSQIGSLRISAERDIF